MAKNTSYIGDGVYAEWTGTHVVLTTENERNRIQLDAPVWNAMLEYFRRVSGKTTREIFLANVPEGASETEIKKLIDKMLDERDQKLM